MDSLFHQAIENPACILSSSSSTWFKMDVSEARLHSIESQRLPDLSHGQNRQRLFSMKKISNSFRVFYGDRGEATPQLEFLVNLKFSDLLDVPGEYVLMNAKMLSILSDGNRDWRQKLRSHATPLACFKNNRGDSVLHLAACWSNLELVKNIISECPCLLLEPNFKDELPIHVAARAGDPIVVEVIVASITFFSDKLADEGREILNPYIMKDVNGDTALNIALKVCNRFQCLFRADQQAWFLANKDGISPLYLAVEAAMVSSVRRVSINIGHGGRNFNLEGRKYLVHAALKSMNRDMLDVILHNFPMLLDEQDEEGRNCLMFGASIGYYDGVCKLLERSIEGVFVCDNDGSYPIHVAVEKGHIKVVEHIIERCPSSVHLLNKKGQNILHIAAETGRFQILCHLRKCKSTSYSHLVVVQDVDGNTPLHLATIKWRPRAVRIFTWTKNLLIQNNYGLTALDIAELNLQPHYNFRERATLLVLVHAHGENNPRFRDTVKAIRPIMHKSGENKDYINALLVVAALIATVTFTAGFTLPGGTKSSTPNLGMANLITDPSLILFLIFDALALKSSLLAIVSLLVAQLGDPTLYHSSVWVAMIALSFAIYSVCFAFFCALGIAVGDAKWRYLVIIVSFYLVSYILAMILPHFILHGYFTQSRILWPVVYFRMNVFDDDGEIAYQSI